MFATTKVTN